MKEILRRLLRFLMTPIRRRYRQRNGMENTCQRKEIPNEILLGLAREMIEEGHSATISVKGYSMRPFLENQRDKVKLEPCIELKKLDAVLAEISQGHYVLHRVIAVNGQDVTLMGDGNVRGTEQCRISDVAGVVTEYIRPNRIIMASDKRLIRRIRIWQRLLPIRRYLLFVYKAVI